MSEPPTPEEEWAKATADLWAKAGPKPLRPIPDELKAEVLREMEWESYDEYTILMIQELEVQGGYSGEEIMAMLEGKPVFRLNWY